MDKTDWAALVFFVLSLVFYVAIYSVIGYVAWHFISKWW